MTATTLSFSRLYCRLEFSSPLHKTHLVGGRGSPSRLLQVASISHSLFYGNDELDQGDQDQRLERPVFFSEPGTQYGLVWPLRPAAPKCFLASRAVLALKRSVLVPVGACMTSSSRVKHLPPALVILARAASVKRSAATLTLGKSRTLSSSVTVETTTTVRSALAPRCLTILERESGGRLVLEEISLLRTVLVKAESVLRERNLNNYSVKIEG